MRGLLILLLALIFGAAAALLLHADAGYVVVRWRGWVLEGSLPGFLAALIGAALLLQLTARLLLFGVRLPRALRERGRQRRDERARASFESGLRHWLEGRWAQAEVELVRYAADHRASELNYLLAAHAAQRQMQSARAEHYLQRASSQGASSAAVLARAEFQMARDESVPARELLRGLHEREPAHGHVLQRYADALHRVQDWAALRALLASPAARAELGEVRHRELGVDAYIGLMQAAVGDARLETLKSLWEGAGALRGQPHLRRAYAQGLCALNAHAEAQAQIAQGLREGWDGELALLYGALTPTDAVSHLAQIEHWLAEFGEKPELLWLAGRACVKARLWGKARSYYETLQRAQPTPAVYLELARLAEVAQKPDEAAKLCKQGLELATAGKSFA